MIVWHTKLDARIFVWLLMQKLIEPIEATGHFFVGGKLKMVPSPGPASGRSTPGYIPAGPDQ